MLIQNMGKAIREQNWFAVAVEILVVIVGLFMAFQLDRWWEQRGDDLQEQMYIQRLVTEVEADIESITYAINLAQVRQNFTDLLIETGRDPQVAMQKPVDFRHFELTTGVLSDEQYLFVQDQWFVVTPETLPELETVTVDQEQVRQAVQRLLERPEALAWLQRVRGGQIV